MVLVQSKFIRAIFTNHRRQITSSVCPKLPDPIVTITGALSRTGENLALLLKQNPLIKELRLYDEEKSTLGAAKDLCAIDTKTEMRCYSCMSLRDAVKGAHVVISVGECPSKAADTEKDAFHKNLDSVRNVAIFLSEFNPKAIFCVAKMPVECLVPMVSEEYKRAEVYDPRKIIGVTAFSSMIVYSLIARQFSKDPASILCPVIGGTAPKSVVPVISQLRPNVEANPKVYAKMQDDAAEMLKKGSKSGYANAVAVSRFVNLILKALRGDTKSAECAFVAQTGHIGEFLPFMTSIVKLGPDGVASTHMPKLNASEVALLKTAEPKILQNVLLGQSFLQGGLCGTPIPGAKRVCDELLKQKIQECDQKIQLPN